MTWSGSASLQSSVLDHPIHLKAKDHDQHAARYREYIPSLHLASCARTNHEFLATDQLPRVHGYSSDPDSIPSTISRTHYVISSATLLLAASQAQGHCIALPFWLAAVKVTAELTERKR